jgi:diaminopimelate decarboxylase
MFEYIATNEPRLVLGGVDVADLADREGTPLYVYDAGVIRQKHTKLADALGPIELLYSIKANPNQVLCRLLAGLGCGAEVASGGELEVALATGFEPDRIIYAGPVKADPELEAAVAAGIRAFVIESPRELARLDAICGSLGKKARALLRISAPALSHNGLEIELGGATKFGVDEEDAGASYGSQTPDNVEIVGIHHFGVSNTLKVDVILASVEHTIRSGHRVFGELGHKLEVVDLGGGAGIPYSEAEREIEIDFLKAGLRRIMERDEAKGVGFSWESGRYLVGECGVYVSRVLDVKESRGKRFVITDGGIHHFSRGLVTGVQHPIRLATKLNQDRTQVYEIGGPICNPLDYLGRSVKLPPVEVGDLIGVFHAGAYGKTMSMLQFLSRPEPKEIVVEGGAVVT